MKSMEKGEKATSPQRVYPTYRKVRSLPLQMLLLTFLSVPFFPTNTFIATFANHTSKAAIMPIATSISSRWTGYSVGFGGNTSYIAASWTVEPVSNHTAIQWIGIQSMQGRLVQVGISMDSSGLPNAYHAFYERYPNEDMMPSFNVSVGDKITASIGKNPSNSTEWNIYLKDLTSNKTLSKTVFYNVSDSVPEWIIEAPYQDSMSGAMPLGNFKLEGFTGISSTINGTSHNLCDKNLVEDVISTTNVSIQNCTAFSVSNVR